MAVKTTVFEGNLGSEMEALLQLLKLSEIQGGTTIRIKNSLLNASFKDSIIEITDREDSLNKYVGNHPQIYVLDKRPQWLYNKDLNKHTKRKKYG